MTPYLDFYYECMKTGRLTNNGLCNCFGVQFDESTWVAGRNGKFLDGNLALFVPEHNGIDYWASIAGDGMQFNCSFNTLRQTIVLFLAAMNNEL